MERTCAGKGDTFSDNKQLMQNTKSQKQITSVSFLHPFIVQSNRSSFYQIIWRNKSYFLSDINPTFHLLVASDGQRNMMCICDD